MSELRAAEPDPAPAPLALELGLYGGALFPASDHELYDSTQSFHAPYRSLGPKAGLRLGWFPLTFLGVEAEGGYAPQENLRGERNHLFDARGHAIVQIPWRVTPFLLAGGGLLGVEGERGGDVDAALHWGGGVKFYATSWMHLRFDGRHVVSGKKGPNTGNTSHFEATAGVGFVLFRGERGEPEVAVVSMPPPSAVEISAAPPPPEDAPEPAKPEVEVVVAKRTLYVEARDPVRFGFDSASVPPSFLPALREVVDLMRARPELDVIVVGHADATGSEAYNLVLSRRRAHAVAEHIRDGGVEPPRIRVRGEGERIPVAPNDTPEGRARNRRTELTVVERREGASGPVEARRAPPSAEE